MVKKNRLKHAQLAEQGKRALLRRNYEVFLHRCFQTVNPGATYLANWHISAIAHHLELVRQGRVKRLIINLPPRHLKSLSVSVAFPAYLLGLDPRRRIFAISYSAELSAKHARDFRSVVASQWYREAFPKMVPERTLDEEVHTDQRGFRKSTSVNGSLTGLGGDLFIIDDPQKPADAQSDVQRKTLNDWFSNTLLSRLDNKETGAIIIVMQRVHLDDLCGYLTSRSDEWTVLNLAAIAETDETIPIADGKFYQRKAGSALHSARESLEILESLKVEIGSDAFAAQYQQSPVPPGGAMIKRWWLHYYDRLPDRTFRSTVIQSWDTAAKAGSQNDWSVCTTWLVHDGKYYLLDLTRGRYEYPELKATAARLAAEYKPRQILIEDASTGSALAQEMKALHFRGSVVLVPIERDKIGRVYVQQATFERGRVLFPRGAIFLPDLERELLTFPQSKHDDQVDSITQALSFTGSSYTLDNIR